MTLRIKCGHQQQPESKMSVALKMFLLYAIGGPIILCITMRIFGAEVALWQPAAATILAAFCTLVLPKSVSGLATFGVTVGFLRYITQAEWEDIVYPVLITNALLFAMTFLLAANNALHPG
jgi:hypothetical protein